MPKKSSLFSNKVKKLLSPIPNRFFQETLEELIDYQTLLTSLPSEHSIDTLDYSKYNKSPCYDLQKAKNWEAFRIFLLDDQEMRFETETSILHGKSKENLLRRTRNKVLEKKKNNEKKPETKETKDKIEKKKKNAFEEEKNPKEKKKKITLKEEKKPKIEKKPTFEEEEKPRNLEKKKPMNSSIKKKSLFADINVKVEFEDSQNLKEIEEPLNGFSPSKPEKPKILKRKRPEKRRTPMKEEIIKKEEDFSEKSLIGKLETDIPERIIGNNTLYDIANKTPYEKRLLLVAWKRRDYGRQPEKSYCMIKDLKTKFPTILLNYYEEILNKV